MPENSDFDIPKRRSEVSPSKYIREAPAARAAAKSKLLKVRITREELSISILLHCSTADLSAVLNGSRTTISPENFASASDNSHTVATASRFSPRRLVSLAKISRVNP